jgi:protein-L-isoaspartate(D-aspartate) O-methyltransferase
VDAEEAFKKVDRGNFVPEELKPMTGIDAPLPIGFGQTISQPFTVKLMLEWLDPKNGDKVLDLGSGSGWTSALLSQLVGSRGKVYAVEIIPELLDFGQHNCQKLGIKNIKFLLASDNAYGIPEFAPYDRILVSAEAKEVPKALLEQIKTKGKMVIPVKNDILEITKPGDKEYETTVHPGFAFVPLVDKSKNIY